MDMVRTISSTGNSSEPDTDNNATTTTSAHAVIAPDGGPVPISSLTTEDEQPSVAKVAAVQDEEDEDDEPQEDDEDMGDEDEDEYEYEYEDEDDAAYGGFLQVDEPAQATAAAQDTEDEPAPGSVAAKPAKIEEEVEIPPTSKKTQWREPTREAVNMSLRAEKETSGSKRRLAQDLYRIMNKDTEETGFSLQPAQEDSMDKWTIKLFQFDSDSNLAKDMLVLGLESIQLEMSFPDQYPFEPPFVRVVQPRFKRQTGFVMNGAICMELLTKDGWNPINDIESVIVSIRSLLVVGEGRLEAAYNLPEAKYKSLLEAAQSVKAAKEQNDEDSKEAAAGDDKDDPAQKRRRKDSSAGDSAALLSEQQRRVLRAEKNGGKYSEADAKAAYEHLSSYHKKKGWDTSGWWARKG